MKKNLIYILVVILACALTGTITYIVVDKQNDKTEIKDNEPSNKENENEKLEQITLSESELEEYLNYVPEQITTNKEEYSYEMIFCKKSTTVNDIKNSDLLAKVLFTLSTGHEENDKIASYDLANKTMNKMYNKPLSTYSNSYDNEGNWLNYSALYSDFGYTYDKGNFYLNYVSNGWESASLIESYEAKEDELIIYSYHVEFSGMYGDNEITDYYNQYSTEISLPSDGYNSEENVIKYLKEHKEKFTKFKHTFKKNDTGYYWYKTEVVK